MVYRNGLWIFLRGGNPKPPWNSLPQAIKAITELGASTKRVCVCTDDRDADDLFEFGLDWVVREAKNLGIKKTTAWSLGSLNPATRFNIDNDYAEGYPELSNNSALLFTTNGGCDANGDINSDNNLDVADVVLIVNLVLNGEQNSTADLNSDGIINILDVILLINIILG